MTQTTSATNPSAQQAQAALWAQRLAAARATQKTGVTGNTGFAQHLTQSDPIPLTKTTVKAQASTESPVAEKATAKAGWVQESRITATPSTEKEYAAKATQVAQGDEEFGFWDFVDLINPLHHIPLVGTAYRAMTEDKIKPEIQVAGSVLFGVATGSVLLSTASGVVSAALEQNTGQEPTVMVAQSLFGGDTVQIPDPKEEAKIVVADAAASSVAQKDNGLTETRTGQSHYTSPALQSAAKISSVQVAPVKTAVSEAKPPEAAATLPVEKKDLTADEALKVLAEEQTKAQQASTRPTPTQFEDLMLKALDKYRAAHKMAPATPETTTANMAPVVD